MTPDLLLCRDLRPYLSTDAINTSSCLISGNAVGDDSIQEASLMLFNLTHTRFILHIRRVIPMLVCSENSFPNTFAGRDGSATNRLPHFCIKQSDLWRNYTMSFSYYGPLCTMDFNSGQVPTHFSQKFVYEARRKRSL